MEKNKTKGYLILKADTSFLWSLNKLLGILRVIFSDKSVIKCMHFYAISYVPYYQSLDAGLCGILVSTGMTTLQKRYGWEKIQCRPLRNLIKYI